MEYVPKDVNHEVNVTQIHPLKYFAKVGLILAFWGVVFYLVSGIIADQVAQVLPPNLEERIGQSLVTPMAAADTRPDVERQLQQLVQELQDQQNIRLPRVQIHLIDSDMINAGMLPGGQMIVTTGLLDTAESENELAFVLAHELGHHQLRHPIRRLGRSLLWLLALSVLGIGQQTPTDPTATLTLADLQFSRIQEQDSDRLALATVAARYGHVDHALDFFQRLQEKNLDPIHQKLQLEFLATHPFPKNRITGLRRYAKRQSWSLSGPATQLDFD